MAGKPIPQDSFLHGLQPAVFEYWLGEATCRHATGNYEEALNTYSISLILQPESALVFYQMGDCLARLLSEVAPF